MKAVFLFAALAMSGALAGVVPVASASPYGYPRHPLGLLGHPAFAPVAPAAVAKVARAPVDEFDPNPQYTYGYEIQHAITGDSKTQQETRSGGVVQGSYSVVDPDGYRRIVEYIADSQHGFNAVVHKQTLAAVNAPRVVLH